jgi:hypothetical protein
VIEWLKKRFKEWAKFKPPLEEFSPEREEYRPPEKKKKGFMITIFKVRF